MDDERVVFLLESLGIDPESFSRLIEWVLCERLVRELNGTADVDEILGKENELLLFRNLVVRRTGKSWSLNDVRALLERVKAERASPARTPISSEEALLLKLTAPLVCVKCGATPPDVVLQMDHIVPSSKGGPSRYENLQFLCPTDNQQKSNKREMEGPWLELV
jgi:5-methylcytosine-specific restriction endonuclease McrA